MVSEWFLMSIEKITNGLFCGRIPGEWIHALYLSRTPVAAGFRKAQVVIGQNSDAQKECSLADDAGGDGEPMPPELLAKSHRCAWTLSD